MFKKLYDDIFSRISAEDIAADNRDAAIRMATAVLMVDVALIDSRFRETEFDRMLKLLSDHFGLSTQDSAELINAANEKADNQSSVRDLIAFLDEQLDQDEKARVIKLLWSVAYADLKLDKYEDSLVLKVGELLNVGHDQVMGLKAQAAAAAAG
jgi:uncharacterized tellurite resistance protein B-like protein